MPRRAIRIVDDARILMQTVMDRGDFAAILDDADRPAERQTLQVCRKWLREENLHFRQMEVRAAKRQWLCAGGALQGAAFF